MRLVIILLLVCPVDQRGYLISTINATTQTTTQVRTAANQVTAFIDALSQTTAFAYDAAGNVKTESCGETEDKVRHNSMCDEKSMV